MTQKTVHIHPEAIEAVETYFDDDGKMVSQVVHTANKNKFSSSEHQYTDPSLTDCMIVLRGEQLEEED